MTGRSTSERAEALRASLLALTKSIEEEEASQRPKIDGVLPKHRLSAANLAHYIGLRKQDVRHLQLELAALGLSSLGRSEGYVHDALLRLLAWLSGERGDDLKADARLNRAKAEALLHANTRALFGPRPPDRHVYIMVTAPDAAQATTGWADEMLQAGADILRINGAHESPREWTAIASGFKSRAAALGKTGRVIVDLPGPKLRTEIRQFEEAVLHLPRCKDRFGRTVAPTPVLLVAEHKGGAQIPVPPEWLPQLATGDVIAMTDAGGRERALLVRGPAEGGVLAECDRSLYVTPGLALTWRRSDAVRARGQVGMLPARPGELRLDTGDAFLLNGSGQSENPALRVLAFPDARLLAQVQPGERVILDDGRLVAVVEEARSEGLLCRVQRALKSPTRLRSGKGVAFPDSTLSRGQLGQQDDVALQFALAHADGVGVSFVNSPQDVALIGERVKQAGRPGFGMILKLETRGAMRNLAGILFEALKYDPVGLMIARGDLAVELSFERLAEMQEELLWFGEACHLPVIWATQVLDTMAHSGLPTRAEVTDAAMSMRAECVMLNKGPYVATATRMLADIIRKMEGHQYKKRSLYRRLAVAQQAPTP
ncbi:MAG: pyruvate kinase [Betaproteobacteria bacterium]|nr:pyruvate kinase [Betaproteobacteria bacterium]